MGEKAIETKVSGTASFMCLFRAISAIDDREFYRGEDDMAIVFIPGKVMPIMKIKLLGRLFIRLFTAPGMYEYVIARTRCFDDRFRQALTEGFDQVVIFGAGFDTRAIRFGQLNQETKVFELDAPITQENKVRLLNEKKVPLPEHLVFVPINFNTQSLEDRLIEAGFRKGVKTLFLLEGVTMYLTDDAVNDTFGFISGNSGPGSMVTFDHIYASVLRKENRYYGEKGMVKSVSRIGEGFTFGIEEGKASDFASKHGLSLIDQCSSGDMERKYFTTPDGQLRGRINGTHCIVTVKKP
jgi:methyltransferase, putative, TIGR00027 family